MKTETDGVECCPSYSIIQVTQQSSQVCIPIIMFTAWRPEHKCICKFFRMLAHLW